MKKAGDFPAQEPIRKLRDLNAVHCPTVKLPTSISGDYSQTMVGIKGWKSSFSLVGGINAPKKITCIGSNGQQYSQLLKGKDDLRQDAVMQQVFNIMNDMLGQSKVTKKDRLNVRTYIITPLSQRRYGLKPFAVSSKIKNDFHSTLSLSLSLQWNFGMVREHDAINRIFGWIIKLQRGT